MAISRQNPNTIYLRGPGMDNPGAVLNHSGPDTVRKYTVGVAGTPGMLAELYADSGVLKYRPRADATNKAPILVFMDRPMFNEGVDDAQPVGDVGHVRQMLPGDEFWGLIPSGQNITAGDDLQSNGDATAGTLKAATAQTADANVYVLQALDTVNATALTRIAVRVI